MERGPFDVRSSSEKRPGLMELLGKGTMLRDFDAGPLLVLSGGCR